MVKSMREATLETLGLRTVLDIFRNGKLPADAGDLVDTVFGKAGSRGALVVSGANGIVGAGKSMQLGSRLRPFDVPVVALDFPGTPDGIGMQYPGLVRGFGPERAAAIMENVISLRYDGRHLPMQLNGYKPRFLLEAIPEILDIKKAHYELFRSAYPGIDIRSVTSGFPSSQLGVGIAHPAFPHEINKIWEIVEPEPSPGTQLFWALGMIPMPVSDDWSFVLDVLFCGLMAAGTRYHGASNMPYWKMDKYIRKHLGPNPFRAHDVIGAKGANFLTWSCLHHCSKNYGAVFEPTSELVERKESGQNWYPMNHFRPLVNWTLDEADEEEFRTWILGPLFQMASLMLKEKRSHLSHMNAIGELCAQFRHGILADIRRIGADEAIRLVEAYHGLHPESATKSWYPEVFDTIGGAEWQQLYVNAEHDGRAGVITISRESYNFDVDAELNRAIDWLKREKIDRVILTGDFHLSTQMIGADTSEFYAGLDDAEAGLRVARSWSQTARRLNDEFEVSVGFVNGKRCLGGFLELLMHCRYFVAVDNAELGLPEVTLPVVPGMEGCHWPFRKTTAKNRPKLLELLLTGKPFKAGDTVGWLADFAGPMDEAIQTVWKIVTDGDHGLAMRKVEAGALEGMPESISKMKVPDDPELEAARKAIVENVKASCGATLAEALDIQSRHAADFMAGPLCRKGRIGADYTKTMTV